MAEAKGKRPKTSQPNSTTDPSRARGAELTKRERVKHITRLMADAKWVTGVTAGELADEWGLHPDTVSKDAAEASRSFELSDDEKATRKARFVAKIESAQGAALAKGRLDATAKLLELEGKALGLFEPDKLEANLHGVGLDDLDELRRAGEANKCPDKPSTGNEQSS